MKLAVKDLALAGNYSRVHALLSREMKKGNHLHGIEIQDIVGDYLCVAGVSTENAKLNSDEDDPIIAFCRDGKEVARLDSTGVLRFRFTDERKMFLSLFGLETFTRDGFLYLKSINFECNPDVLTHYLPISDPCQSSLSLYRSITELGYWMGVKWSEGDAEPIVLTPIAQYQSKRAEIAPPYLIQLPSCCYAQTPHNRFTADVQGKDQWDRFRKRVTSRVNAYPFSPLRQKADRIWKRGNKVWLTLEWYNMIPYKGHWSHEYLGYNRQPEYYGNIIVCESLKDFRFVSQASQKPLSDLEALANCDEWELIGPWFWKPEVHKW